ncbi:toxin YoeB [Nocardia sp. GAS34]|uniref:Txe/YoeB family addiction module toxin n=1 Tax=unclassified Nocardia TaxID=2637762 RepID=UPI003D22FCB3
MSPKVIFDSNGWEDYRYWQLNDRKLLRRINLLIEDIRRRGNADGIGKPEPLKQNLSGWWSRRIDNEHRIVYHADDDAVTVIACRGHYDD